ncbi:MAG: RNA polymerase sigma factor [Clostridia bacterium]
MTQAEFEERIVGMVDTLYRVSTTLLPQLCDREDAVQGAIEKAWQKQGKLRDDCAFQAWVIRILINECYTLLRRRKREVLSDTLPERETAEDANPDLYELFTSLAEKYRLPMVLYYVEGYSVEETARMLELPQGTLKSRLHRGRLLLKDTLDMEEVRI